MRFYFERFASILFAVAVILICSCEKHHVGEMPDVQKEHAEGGAESKAAAGEESTVEKPPVPKATPTPAEFFPSKP